MNGGNTTKGTQRGNVLIVDDDPCITTLVSEIAKPYFLSVVCANNGLEAISIILDQEFDLVFMDVEMPKLNGIAASRVIRC